MTVVPARTDLYEIYLDLAAAFRLPVRMFSREATEKQGLQARERAETRGLLFHEHLVYPWPRRTRDVFLEEIPKLPPGVSEIFAHPVLDGEELRAYDPEHAHIRAHDAACLRSRTSWTIMTSSGSASASSAISSAPADQPFQVPVTLGVRASEMFQKRKGAREGSLVAPDKAEERLWRPEGRLTGKAHLRQS